MICICIKGDVLYTHTYKCTNGCIYKVILDVILFSFLLFRIAITEIPIFKNIIGIYTQESEKYIEKLYQEKFFIKNKTYNNENE